MKMYLVSNMLVMTLAVILAISTLGSARPREQRDVTSEFDIIANSNITMPMNQTSSESVESNESSMSIESDESGESSGSDESGESRESNEGIPPPPRIRIPGIGRRNPMKHRNPKKQRN